MLIAAIILFIIALLLGLIILTAVLQDRPSNKTAVYLHGITVGVALLCVIIYMFIVESSPLLISSLILFILAALGGLTLFTIDIKNRPIPKMLAVLHPVIAVAGLVVLIIYVLP